MSKAVISISSLKNGMIVAEPVLSNAGTHRNMIICRKDSVLTNRVINLLELHEVQKVEVYSDFTNSLEAKIPTCNPEKENQMQLPQITPIIPPFLKEKAVINIRNLFEAIRVPANQ